MRISDWISDVCSSDLLVLASGSAARTALLTAAGVAHDVMVAQVDEDSAKQAFRERGLQPRDIADGLAELKAVKVSQRRPEALVLGADQIDRKSTRLNSSH